MGGGVKDMRDSELTDEGCFGPHLEAHAQNNSYGILGRLDDTHPKRSKRRRGPIIDIVARWIMDKNERDHNMMMRRRRRRRCYHSTPSLDFKKLRRQNLLHGTYK
jgi:hypothetical protein